MSDMHVSFTIPGWFFWALIAYYLIGLLAYLPLLAYTNKKLLSTPRPSLYGFNLLKMLVVGVLYPWFFYEIPADKRKNRKSLENYYAAKAREEMEYE